MCYKLSYIKNEGDKESGLYYLFRILNAKISQYEPESIELHQKKSDYIQIEGFKMGTFNQYDLMRYRLCKFRFLMESVIEEKSVYKDEFLLQKYLTIVLEHRARNHFDGKVFVKNIVFDYLNDQMDELKDKFVFINHADSIDIVRNALTYLKKFALYNGKFMNIKEKEIDHMVKREDFLTTKISKDSALDEKKIFKNSTQQEVDEILNEERLNDVTFRKTLNVLCATCSEKDICLESFKTKKA